MTKNRVWTLTPTHTLTLAPPNKWGYCHRCETKKDIRLISETDLEFKQFCWSCSRDDVFKLEIGDYPVENKEQIVKELREALRKPQEEENILNYG